MALRPGSFVASSGAQLGMLGRDGDGQIRDTVDEIDADFEGLTIEDSRYSERFSAQAGHGWWWREFPPIPRR